MRDLVAPLVLPLVAVLCCLAVPLILSAGVGVLALVVGAGVPLAGAAAAGAWLVTRKRG